MDKLEALRTRKEQSYKLILNYLKHSLALRNTHAYHNCSGCDNDVLCSLIINPIDYNFNLAANREIKREKDVLHKSQPVSP